MKRGLVLLTVAFALATAPGAQARDGLPLGPRSLPETRTTDVLAPGVTYTKIVRGRPSSRDGWTADVAIVVTRHEAQDLAERVRDAGYDAEVSRLERAPDDPEPGPLGFRVRSGIFTARADADVRVAALKAAGLPARGSVFTAEDGTATTGPWVVHVLSIADPGRATNELATGIVPGRETLTAMSARTGALTAVNGGYFVIGEADGTPGDLAGSAILRGRLVSEAVDGRTDLFLGAGGSFVSALRDAQQVMAADGSVRELDGDNRKPGLIRACGGTGGDTPTEEPLHDVTCTDPSELIRFTPDFGAATDTGDGAEAVLDAAGKVTELREPRGGSIPAGGSVVAGTGDAADWLRAHAHPGEALRVDTSVTTERGPLAPGPDLGVVNGGPRLLRDGHPDITADAEGFDHQGDPAFYYAFALRRNPRTIAGIARDGRLMLVAVDGRAPGYSAGLDFEEEAAVMRALGAADAVNLDGGGSTTMTIRGRLVTRPSDAAGERPIGDAILVSP